MANIKVRDLADTTTITSDNQIMVLTNDQNNLVQNITVSNFNQNIISTDADNGIEQGSDGGLYVNNADSGVTAGTYQYPQNLVVNEKGQITSVVSGSPTPVPIATTTQAGIVKPDGTTITVEADGTISIQDSIDEITTDLNGKVDKSSLAEVIPVIKEDVNGQSGYRIWSSGYCEQWGYSSTQQPTINFVKTFANTNYVFRCQGIQSGGAYYQYGETRTTNSVAITSNFTSGIGYWIASGYLASGEY